MSSYYLGLTMTIMTANFIKNKNEMKLVAETRTDVYNFQIKLDKTLCNLYACMCIVCVYGSYVGCGVG